jgi:4-hydroxy-tetrahydrodipicolinate synthase
MFRGAFTALVTPFRNGEIDFVAFERLIETQIKAGVSGIVPVGTTGESPTLSHDERNEVIGRAVRIANQRCVVLAGTGSNSTREAIAATQEAEKLGADGALVVAPYYNKPSQEGLFRHFQAIAQCSALPVVLYNIPGRCGVDIAADTVVRLAADCANIVAIKEAAGSVDRVSELVTRVPNEFSILSGDDSLTLPFLSVGAVGVVSVASNVIPMEVVGLVKAYLSGDIAAAQRLHRHCFALFKHLFIEPNPVPAKTVLAWRGEMSSECRLPLCEMSAANEARLRATVEELERALR